MKLLYYVKDVGVTVPVIHITGTIGGLIPFLWDRQRCVFTREYDLSKPEEIARLRDEQMKIFNQRLAWPVFTEIIEDEKVEIDPASVTDLQEAKEQLELAKGLIAQQDKELSELKTQLAGLQRVRRPPKMLQEAGV